MAASGSTSEQHPTSAGDPSCGLGLPRLKKAMGESAGFSQGFGSNFAVWVLISGLQVLSDSGGL
jgi:hypothetical protein